MSRRTAARFGKMPTTSVPAPDLLVEALLRVFDQTCLQWATGKAVMKWVWQRRQHALANTVAMASFSPR